MKHLKNMKETRALFLDISKTFDKVWHDRLIFKLKCNCISGSLLELFQNYLQNRYQRVVLNGKVSHWRSINARVPKDLF